MQVAKKQPQYQDSSLSDAHDRPLVLVVEDDAAMNETICEILGSSYRTASAFNGEQALEIAARLNPDLVLSDIMMPKMKGDQMFRQMKEKKMEIPIVFISSHSDGDLRVQLLREGADDYLIKPFIAEELRARVRNLLQLREASIRLKLEVEARTRSELAIKEIISIVSHDLKSPLTSINLSVHLLDKAFASSPQTSLVKHSQAIRKSAKQMERLVKDLLDFAQIETGTLSIDRRPHRLEQFVHDGLLMVEHQIAQKKMLVTVDGEPNLPTITYDLERMTQLFYNLLGNAIKFSPAASTIAVRAMRLEQHIQVSVSDRGPGIRLEDQENIFQKFWQAKETAALGSGLGLFIAKNIISLHGGKIWVESGTGPGATFYFTLPIDQNVIT